MEEISRLNLIDETVTDRDGIKCYIHEFGRSMTRATLPVEFIKRNISRDGTVRYYIGVDYLPEGEASPVTFYYSPAPSEVKHAVKAQSPEVLPVPRSNEVQPTLKVQMKVQNKNSLGILSRLVALIINWPRIRNFLKNKMGNNDQAMKSRQSDERGLKEFKDYVYRLNPYVLPEDDLDNTPGKVTVQNHYSSGFIPYFKDLQRRARYVINKEGSISPGEYIRIGHEIINEYSSALPGRIIIKVGANESRWIFPENIESNDYGTVKWAKRILGLEDVTSLTRQIVWQRFSAAYSSYFQDKSIEKARMFWIAVRAVDTLIPTLPKPKDPAMNIRNMGLNKGGIDFNSNKMHLQIQNNNSAIKFHLDRAQLAQLQKSYGFEPDIISMQPMYDLRRFLTSTGMNS